MGFNIGGAITSGLGGFAASGGNPWGAALGAVAGGFFGPETPSYNAPSFQPIPGIPVIPTNERMQTPGALGLSPLQTPGLVPNINSSYSYMPGGVRTGFGNVTVDANGNLVSSGSPALTNAQNTSFNIGQGYLDQAQVFSPDQYAANVSQRLQNLAAPSEEKARLDLEQRLFNQGMLTSTSGGRRMQDLYTAQALAGEQRALDALNAGETVQNNLLSRGYTGINNAISMDPSNQLFGTSLALGQGYLGAEQLGLSADQSNQQAAGVNAGNVLNMNQLGLTGDQLLMSQQQGLFGLGLNANQQDFAQRLAAGDLEIKNQVAQQGNVNPFNIANSQQSYVSDLLRADSNNAFLGGVMNNLGAFQGTGFGGWNWDSNADFTTNISNNWNSFWNQGSINSDLDAFFNDASVY